MKAIIKFLKSLFTTETIQTSLEAYIVAGNPQDAGDVDRLEREFYRKNEARRSYGYL